MIDETPMLTRSPMFRNEDFRYEVRNGERYRIDPDGTEVKYEYGFEPVQITSEKAVPLLKIGNHLIDEITVSGTGTVVMTSRERGVQHKPDCELAGLIMATTK
jgi:hypothetical protein